MPNRVMSRASTAVSASSGRGSVSPSPVGSGMLAATSRIRTAWCTREVYLPGDALAKLFGAVTDTRSESISVFSPACNDLENDCEPGSPGFANPVP